MRTAIFVYQATPINISTSESDLQLCGMSTESASLSEGDNARTIAAGIYKIVSSHDVQVTGDTSAFDVIIEPNDKTDIPPPSSVATASFAPLDLSALQTFFAIPDAKVVANP